eukprot:GILI01029064.1.p1 GENE.GILI01029064.1~~GILI01029064.1.p1  ORF type:complete len:200 (+),score=15.66 GILI01029064.1:51-650(+)
MFRRCTSLLQSVSNKAFIDVAIGKEAPRRITFELFTQKCPLASENFVKLCTGELVLPREPTPSGLSNPQFEDQLKPQLHYVGSTFHRVMPKFLVQAGDIVDETGYHQLSAFGRTFEAPNETETSVFDKRGLIGTAVSAPNMNGSQFFILTSNGARHLDGTCICFGRVASGMDVVEDIERVQLLGGGLPAERIVIVNSGV